MRGKEYERPMGANWWLKRRPYTIYMLREVTALFIGGYAIFLIVMIWRAAQASSPSDPAWVAFVEGLKSPVSLVLHLLVLAAALFHSITWINATPKAVAIWRGEEKVSDSALIGGSYVLWAVVSVIVAALAFSVR